MVNDHEPISVNVFRGLYDRDEDDSVPQGFFVESQNNRFLKNGFKSREGSSSAHILNSVRRIWIYKRAGEAQRLLILNGVNEIYDSTSLGAPILTVTGMIDFSAECIFGRAYITPHNGVTGLAGEKVYVYSGSGTARAAAGLAPVSPVLTVVDSALSGNCEEGEKILAVAYLTDTGYITAPSGYVLYNPAGGKRLSVDDLPLGPSGTSGRVLLSTKTLVGDFNGDFIHQTYYFIPDGTVDDNTTTDYDDTLSFFDNDLEEDASYLLEQLDEIPAGVGIGLYLGKLTVWGEDSNPSICRVSKNGQPESVNAADGFVSVNPGDAGHGLSNCWDFRGQLICDKRQRSYFTSDNGDVAATWAIPQPFDAAVGTTPHGVATVMDFGKMVQDFSIVAHESGLWLFNGTYAESPLSSNIDGLWGRINRKNFHKIEVALDPHNFCLYAVVPLDGATEPSHVIYGDYTEGLAPDLIKWDLWTFPRPPHTVVVDLDNTTNETVMKFGALLGNVYKMDESQTNDFGTSIAPYAKIGLLPVAGDDVVRQFGGVRVRVKGSGTLRITAYGLDDTPVSSTFTATLALAPGKPIWQGFNLTSERCAVKLAVTTADHYYTISKFSLFAVDLWETR